MSWAATIYVLTGSTAILLLIHFLNGRLQGESLRGYAVIAFGVANVSFGGILVRRIPRNRIGWILSAAAVILVTTEAAGFYGGFALLVNTSFPAGAFAAWISSWTAPPAIGVMVSLLVLLFPDGHLPSRSWRVLGIGSAAFIALVTVFGAISTYPSHGGVVRIDDVGSIVNADTLGGDLSNLIGFAFLGLLILFGFSLAGLFSRRRHASAILRQQLKWFVFANAFILVVGFVPHIASGTIGFSASITYVISAFFIASFLLVPVATGMAILRYRLYDIDVVIRRTLVYGSLALCVTAVYVGIAVGFGALIGGGGRPNLALSILATAIVAVAFQPVRERMQRVANRLVYGKRATPYEMLSQFSERVAETYAADQALPRMARVLAGGTGAERCDVWLRSHGVLRCAASWPASDLARVEDVPLTAESIPEMVGTDRAVEVRNQGDLLGALTVTKRTGESLTPVEEKLLDDLAHQAGLVLKNVGLTAELRQRLDDLRASRQRLVAAQDEERRRLERNLHDGAQQNLVALKLKLGLVEMLATQDPARARTLMGEVKCDADEALETLRDLARGIYPPLLAERGLGAALESQARKATVPVTVDANIGRHTPEIEAAIYFCCLEALQNVQKYGSATQATVCVSEAGGELRFAVADDGCGFDTATTKRGSGLQNMEDRLDALGGSLTVTSVAGGGTTVTGHIPSLVLAAA